MRLTALQLEQVENHIGNFSPIECSVCHEKPQWFMSPEISFIPETKSDVPGRQAGARGVAVLRCPICANVLMFDLGDLNLIATRKSHPLR